LRSAVRSVDNMNHFVHFAAKRAVSQHAAKT
jgi:hypothetical protein